MRKLKKILLMVFVLVIIGVSFYIFKGNKKNLFDNDKAINVVKMYIRAENEKNIEKAKSHILNTKDKDKINLHTLENEIKAIKTINFISAEKAKTEYKPESYIMSDGNKVKIEQGVILNVIYNVVYKDNNQPAPSGKNSMLFKIVKLDDDYKIVDIGTGP